jgi:transposase-like protein
MKKSVRKPTRNQGTSAPEQRKLRLAAVLRENLYEFIIGEGMKAVQELLEQDRERLCGPAYAKGDADAPQRWGATDGRLVMGGRRVTVRKPRVRHGGKEVTLPSWAQFADEDPLEERTVEQMVLGVSTRGYDRSVEPIPDELGPHGASKSAASRRFVTLTAEKVETWLKRDLTELRIAVVFIDGIEVNDQTVIVALGVDETGGKHALGLWHGATENATVCESLLTNLVERGLDPQRGYLFVIDGAKGLRQAIRTIFGKRTLVQRCQEHKRRNVLGHLPKSLQPSVARSLRDAYASGTQATARKRLLQLVAHLGEEYPDAAASLREGLDETLTLKDMKLPTILERTLSTTNPIENLNGSIRRVTRNVKRWRDGSMVRRWVAVGILEASRGFRRLRGCHGMATLVATLRRHAEQTHRIDPNEQAA